MDTKLEEKRSSPLRRSVSEAEGGSPPTPPRHRERFDRPARRVLSGVSVLPERSGRHGRGSGVEPVMDETAERDEVPPSTAAASHVAASRASAGANREVLCPAAATREYRSCNCSFVIVTFSKKHISAAAFIK